LINIFNVRFAFISVAKFLFQCIFLRSWWVNVIYSLVRRYLCLNGILWNFSAGLQHIMLRAANHYDFWGIITNFCSSLRPYSENYHKSAFSRNSSIWYSSDNVLASHCITQLVFWGLYRGRCLFSTASVLLTTWQLL